MTHYLGDTFTAPTFINPNNIDGITFTSSNTAVATVTSVGVISLVDNDNAFGTATITATLSNNATYADAEVNVIITVKPADVVFYESFNECAKEGGNDGIWSGINTTGDISADQNGWDFTSGNQANKCARFGTSKAQGKAITPALGLAAGGTLYFKAGAWNGNSENTTLKLSIEGNGSISPNEVTMTKGAFKFFRATITGADAGTKVKFLGYTTSDSRFFLDEVYVCEARETVTITTADYATFSSSRAVDFSATGISVYKAKVNGDVVKLTEVAGGIVPANTGVILYKDVDASTSINVPCTTTDATITDNELVPTVTRTLVKKTDDDTHFNYIMQLDGEDIVFNMATTAGAYMPAGRAYLSTTVDASDSDARLSVVFDDEAAGITAVKNAPNESNQIFYNLNGQRVDQPKKGGLYIIHGRKVVVK